MRDTNPKVGLRGWSAALRARHVQLLRLGGPIRGENSHPRPLLSLPPFSKTSGFYLTIHVICQMSRLSPKKSYPARLGDGKDANEGVAVCDCFVCVEAANKKSLASITSCSGESHSRTLQRTYIGRVSFSDKRVLQAPNAFQVAIWGHQELQWLLAAVVMTAMLNHDIQPRMVGHP